MGRRALAWFVSAPLIAGGVEGGHWLAYRIAYPNPYLRAQALAGSGHSYLSYAPLFFAVMGAVGLCALGAHALGRGRGGPAVPRVSPMPFLLVSPVAFALQECIERLFVGGWPFSAALAPTFMPGLVFQLPFALLAFLLARWLLRAADRLRLLLFRESALPSFVAAVVRRVQAATADLPRLAPLAAGYGERGPPARLVPAYVCC